MTDECYQRATTPELLAAYGRILAELRARGVVRTNNAPAGDYAEWLVASALGGTLADDRSAKSYDLTLPDGRLVQVKARVVDDERPTRSQTQTSAFRSWDFDLAGLVLLRASDHRPGLGVLVPVDVVREHARFRAHVNASVVFIRPPLTTCPEAVDITDQLVAVAG